VSHFPKDQVGFAIYFDIFSMVQIHVIRCRYIYFGLIQPYQLLIETSIIVVEKTMQTNFLDLEHPVHHPIYSLCGVFPICDIFFGVELLGKHDGNPIHSF